MLVEVAWWPITTGAIDCEPIAAPTEEPVVSTEVVPDSYTWLTLTAFELPHWLQIGFDMSPPVILASWPRASADG